MFNWLFNNTVGGVLFQISKLVSKLEAIQARSEANAEVIDTQVDALEIEAEAERANAKYAAKVTASVKKVFTEVG